MNHVDIEGFFKNAGGRFRRVKLVDFDQLNPEQRVRALERNDFLAELKASRLKGPDQLPDLDFENGPNRLVWDMELDADGKRWNVIRHDTRVIWRQRAIWEGFEEFSRIVAIIRERYGKMVCDVVPTKSSEMWLGGDSIGASGEEISKARWSLRKRFPG